MNQSRYIPEFSLLAATSVLSILGFWELYFGSQANPQPHHFLHTATSFIWLFLLFAQLYLVSRGKYHSHKSVGMFVLGVAPLVIGTTAALSVHSAHKGLLSGQGDFLIVQNVMVTVQLALLVILAFLFRKRRALHGSLLISTAILFAGIALFFTLIGFIPMFRIEGPETFYRFGTAAMTGQAICLAAGFLLFVTSPRTRWPYLLAAAFFPLNGAINGLLEGLNLIDPLTVAVGSQSPILTFFATFLLVLLILWHLIGPITGQAPERRADQAGV